jgi:signal transduction histidine kinase
VWFTRRLALKLLAPTVLVSSILVGVCLLGTLYLNSLHVNATAVLSENVQSTQAAARLETTAKELLRLLRAGHEDRRGWERRVEEQNHTARELLVEAERLANLERESVLVNRIAAGLREYLQGWEQRSGVADARRARYDANLADLLEREVLLPCIELRTFNTDQIEKADRENRSIIQGLQWGMIAVAVCGPLSGLLLGYAVARSLYRSIYQLSVHIRDAAGRLSREVGSVTLEEKGDLPDLHQQMQGVLREIGRVVDELEQREREVLRAEHLAAVGQVAAGVAHELRNPLTSIKLLVQTWLEEGPATGLPSEELAIIEREIRRIEQRLQSFLDFARPARCERRQADLGEVVRRAVALVEGRARRQKVSLEVHLPPEPVRLKIDPEQVHQVLLNLLLNALDALPHGGVVQVEVECRPGSEGGSVEVRVRDSGPGILPHIAERLFEPFVSSKESGLGLGLSICKRLVEAHGGTIRGENGRRGGAVFCVTFPLEEAHATLAGRG